MRIAHKMRPIAVALAFGILAGCAVHTPVQSAALQGSSGPTQVIDLARGSRTPSGWASVTLQVDGLSADRTTQSLSSQGAILMVAVTDYQHHTLIDGNGNLAVYQAKVTSGAATIVLPPLPPTAFMVVPNSPSAHADIFSTFLVKSTFPVSNPPRYTDLQNYGTDTANPWTSFATGDPVLWNHIDYDLTSGPDATPTHTTYLMGTGEVAADVAPGYPMIVPLTNWFMVGAKFNETSPPAGFTAADESALYVSGFTVTTGGTLNLRYPGFVNTQLTNFSGTVMRLVSDFTGINGPAVNLTAATFDNTNPLAAPTVLGTADTPLAALTLAQSNATTVGQAAYSDIDVSSVTSTTNLDLTLTGLPSTATVLLLDRNAYGALSSNTVGSSLLQ